MTLISTLIVEASHDGIRQPGGSSLLVAVHLQHRRLNQLQRAPSLVVDVAARRVDEGLSTVPPAAVGAPENGHQQPDARQYDGVSHRRAAISLNAAAASHAPFMTSQRAPVSLSTGSLVFTTLTFKQTSSDEIRY